MQRFFARTAVACLCLSLVACDGVERVSVNANPPLALEFVGTPFSIEASYEWAGAEDGVELFAEVDGPVAFESGPVKWPEPTGEEISQLSFRCLEVGEATITVLAKLGSAGKPDRVDVDVICVSPEPDELGDHFYSDPSQEPGLRAEEIDIAVSGVTTAFIDSTLAERVNEYWPCGRGDGMQVVCPDDASELDDGEYVFAVTEFAAEIPEDGTPFSTTFAAVFDSDGLEFNNWIFKQDYSLDTYQGTDFWVEVKWEHMTKTWDIVVWRVTAPCQAMEVVSGARGVVFGDRLVIMIPRAELEGDNPRWRTATFGTFGGFDPDNSGVDVLGEEPNVLFGL